MATSDKIRLTPEMESNLIEAEKELDQLGPALDAFDKIGGDTTAFRAIMLDARNRIQHVRKYFGNSPGSGY